MRSLLLLLTLCGASAPVLPVVPPILLHGESAAPQLRSAEAPEEGWIPIELFRERWIFLEGRVNGVDTDLMLDSAAGMTVMNTTEAARRGLRGGRRIRAEGVGGIQEARVHHGVFVELDGVRLGNLRVAVIDLAEVEANLGRQIPFILGIDVFRSTVVDIDYPNSRVAFRDPETFAYSGPGAVVPLIELQEGRWAVELTVEGKGPGRFQVDTGSGQTLTLFEGFTSRHRLLEGRSPTSSMLSGGVGGMIDLTIGTLDSVELGGATLVAVPASFHSGDEGIFANMQTDGNLGAGILERYRLVFDTRRLELALEPTNDAEVRPFPRDRTGLNAILTADGLAVIQVAPGSPASEAGWEVGAVVRAIDGEPIRADYWQAQSDWRIQPAGTRVVLEDGKGDERVLVLADYF